MSIKNQHGIALFTVMVFLLVMSLTWLAFSLMSSYERGVFKDQLESEQASYVAEAGIQQALWGLSQHPFWMTDNWWITQFGGTRGTDTDEKGQQYQYYQWTGNLGLLWPGDIRAIDRHYTVRIRDHGLIKDKIVSTGTVETSLRKLETELASAFDYGLYSYDQPDKMDFSGSFTVTGDKQTGYVYATQEISNPANLHADKITGNYQNAPAPYYFFPKEIPLPYPGFKATIHGAPTSTSIQYTNDTGEGSLGLVSGKQLYNITQNMFRTIQSVDPSTKTITTYNINDTWASGDEIIDDYYQGNPFFSTTIQGTPTSTIIQYTNDAGEDSPGLVHGYQLYNRTRGTARTIESVDTSNNTITTDASTDTWASGDEITESTIAENKVIQGDATFSNVTINGGLLYVTGSLVITQNLTGSNGGIIVSGDITINGQVTGGSVNSPLFIVTKHGNLIINTLGPSFYGLVYAGGNISSINAINIAGGNIIANNFSSALNGGSINSITNQDWKNNLSALGFSNKDFVRPLFWRETTE